MIDKVYLLLLSMQSIMGKLETDFIEICNQSKILDIEEICLGN